jgi:hypothetical protein
MRSGDKKTSTMNFYAFLDVDKMPKKESTTRKIAYTFIFDVCFSNDVPDLLTSRFKTSRGAHFYNNTPGRASVGIRLLESVPAGPLTRDLDTPLVHI